MLFRKFKFLYYNGKNIERKIYMKVLANDIDERINANNILIKMSLQEYYELSQNILKNNEFQRKRVKSSSTVYNLLKTDLQRGCLIPTIFLALEENTHNMSNDKIIELIGLKKDKLVILDGLQRTYTICDLVNELIKDNQPLLDKVKNNQIRIELYTGINKIGILYRMLTLNTGQTPMSMRHQIEIIYSDYINQDLSGIKLIREVDDNIPQSIGEYKFSDIIEGFSSYLTQNYLTMDRGELLENIKSLENLSKDVNQKDIFKDFLDSFNSLVLTLNRILKDWEYDDENYPYELNAQPFAKQAIKIFNKSQAITGFGAAIGIWIKDGTIKDFKELKDDIIPNINCISAIDSMNNLIKNFDEIRITAKKIGNDQRFYFYNLFKILFDKENDAYLNLDSAINKAMRSYERANI